MFSLKLKKLCFSSHSSPLLYLQIRLSLVLVEEEAKISMLEVVEVCWTLQRRSGSR